jgi:hypothetical protein
MSCSFILTRGKNKGNSCGKKCLKDSEFCKNHAKQPQDDQEACNGCQFVLTRGVSKGQLCNKKVRNDEEYCYTHSKNVSYNKCPVILTRGSRKGQTCDRRCKNSDMCSIHKKNDEPQEHVEQVDMQVEKCQYIFKNGKNKGGHCNGKVKTDSLCARHCKKQVGKKIQTPVMAVIVENEPESEPVMATLVETGEADSVYDSNAYFRNRLTRFQPESEPQPEPESEPQPEPESEPESEPQPEPESEPQPEPESEPQPEPESEHPGQVIPLPRPYNTDEIPKSVDKETIVFEEKEQIEVEIEPFIVSEKIKSKKKMTNNVSVFYNRELNSFSFKSKSGTYTLYELLMIVYYLYSICPEVKQSLTITTLTLENCENGVKLNLR